MAAPRSRALRKLRRDRFALAGSAVILLYTLTAIGVRLGAFEWVGAHQAEPIVTEPQAVAYYSPPSASSWQRWLGTDRQGRSILVRAVSGIDVAMTVGLLTGLAAVAIGTLLGALAGYAGGAIDAGVVWLYSTVESIPYLLLILVLSYSAEKLFGKGLITVCFALGATFWTGPCRVIRGEAIRLRDSDFVTAAIAQGASRARIVVRHVIPNVAHVSLVYFSLAFISAVKAEVILSFLGFGVQDRPSWGLNN